MGSVQQLDAPEGLFARAAPVSGVAHVVGESQACTAYGVFSHKRLLAANVQ